MEETILDLRKEFMNRISHLSFCEKKHIIKLVNKELLTIYNRGKGTKYLHSLNYLHKMPSKFSKDRKDYILYLYRNIILLTELKKISDQKKAKLNLIK